MKESSIDNNVSKEYHVQSREDSIKRFQEKRKQFAQLKQKEHEWNTNYKMRLKEKPIYKKSLLLQK